MNKDNKFEKYNQQDWAALNNWRMNILSSAHDAPTKISHVGF